MSNRGDAAVLEAMRASAKSSMAAPTDGYEDDFEEAGPPQGQKKPVAIGSSGSSSTLDVLKAVASRDSATRKQEVDAELRMATNALPQAKTLTEAEAHAIEAKRDRDRDAKEGQEVRNYDHEEEDMSELKETYNCYSDMSDDDSDNDADGESDGSNPEAGMTKEEKVVYHSRHAIFFEKIASGNKSDVDKILSNKKEVVNISYVDRHNWTAIHWAALNGREVIINTLIEHAQSHGVVPKRLVAQKEAVSGWTALHLACLHGHAGCARTLIRIGASACTLSLIGERPYDLVGVSVGLSGINSAELKEVFTEAYSLLARPWRHCISHLFRDRDLPDTVQAASSSSKRSHLALLKSRSKWAFNKGVTDILPMPSIVPLAPITLYPLLQYKSRKDADGNNSNSSSSSNNSNNNNNNNNNSSSQISRKAADANKCTIDDILLCRFMCFIGYECGVKGIRSKLIKANIGAIAHLPRLLGLPSSQLEAARNSALCRNFLKAFGEHEKLDTGTGGGGASKVPFSAGMAMKVFERLAVTLRGTSTGRELLMHCRLLTAMLLGIFFIVPKSEFLRRNNAPRSGFKRSDLMFFDNSDNEISHESVGKQKKTSYLVIPCLKAKASGYQRIYKHFRQDNSSSRNICIVSILEEWIAVTQSMVRSPEAYLFSYPDQPDLTSDDVEQAMADYISLTANPTEEKKGSLRLGGAISLSAAGLPHYLVNFDKAGQAHAANACNMPVPYATSAAFPSVALGAVSLLDITSGFISNCTIKNIQDRK